MLVITAALTQDGNDITSPEGPAAFDKTMSVIFKRSVRLPDDKWNLTFCYVDPLFFLPTFSLRLNSYRWG